MRDSLSHAMELELFRELERAELRRIETHKPAPMRARSQTNGPAR